MNIPDYTPQDMVRLELLLYDNPEGLHPIEANWRNLARKLMNHVQHIEEKATKGFKSKWDFDKEFENYKPFEWPKQFKFD